MYLRLSISVYKKLPHVYSGLILIIPLCASMCFGKRPPGGGHGPDLSTRPNSTRVTVS